MGSTDPSLWEIPYFKISVLFINRASALFFYTLNLSELTSNYLFNHPI